jgi:hypothetical protein
VTPRGVALFARATTGRLWIVQFAVALIVALTMIWFAHTAWFPTVRQAIQHLPDAGEIRGGQLHWPGSSPRVLAEGTFIAFSVDLDHNGEARAPAHVEVEFGRDSFLFRSLLGYVELPYPRGWVLVFNREELGPWWGAWSPMLLVMAVLILIVWFLVLWNLLAALYAPPLWLLAFFVNRDLKWRECWRLAGAALMPAALLMTLGILMYGLGVVDLLGLASIFIGHLVVVWIYLFLAPLFLPLRGGAVGTQNPFKPIHPVGK